jgi:hypothetical protein
LIDLPPRRWLRLQRRVQNVQPSILRFVADRGDDEQIPSAGHSHVGDPHGLGPVALQLDVPVAEQVVRHDPAQRFRPQPSVGVHELRRIVAHTAAGQVRQHDHRELQPLGLVHRHDPHALGSLLDDGCFAATANLCLLFQHLEHRRREVELLAEPFADLVHRLVAARALPLGLGQRDRVDFAREAEEAASAPAAMRSAVAWSAPCTACAFFLRRLAIEIVVRGRCRTIAAIAARIIRALQALDSRRLAAFRRSPCRFERERGIPFASSGASLLASKTFPRNMPMKIAIVCLVVLLAGAGALQTASFVLGADWQPFTTASANTFKDRILKLVDQKRLALAKVDARIGAAKKLVTESTHGRAKAAAELQRNEQLRAAEQATFDVAEFTHAALDRRIQNQQPIATASGVELTPDQAKLRLEELRLARDLSAEKLGWMKTLADRAAAQLAQVDGRLRAAPERLIRLQMSRDHLDSKARFYRALGEMSETQLDKGSFDAVFGEAESALDEAHAQLDADLAEATAFFAPSAWATEPLSLGDAASSSAATGSGR